MTAAALKRSLALEQLRINHTSRLAQIAPGIDLTARMLVHEDAARILIGNMQIDLCSGNRAVSHILLYVRGDPPLLPPA